MRELVWLIAVVGCGGKATPPAQQPTAAEVAPEADALNRTWIVEKHIMVKGSTLDEADAKGFYGRTVEITAKTFMSPWQGTCEAATRALERRELAAVVAELGIKAADQQTLEKFGLTNDIAEFRLRCSDRESPPPFLIYVSNNKAMTCYRGACYLLVQF
ncbi:MAG: hypothetical protein H0T42_32665 [Deltaproteobacteria bacterium]|nr:hypothetical protein [Deltaproteobacteria bacterium]